MPFPTYITRRPYDRNWSGNPIPYRILNSYAAHESDFLFEVRVHFRYIGDNDWTVLPALPFYPFEGYADVDVAQLLDCQLKHTLPDFDEANERKAWIAKKQAAEFYISFRYVWGETTSDWNTSESEYVRLVYKGGINYHHFRGNNFWVNYFDDELTPFLTWQVSKRLAGNQERMYLGYMITDDLGNNTRYARIKILYTDGTFEFINCPKFNGAKGTVWFVPVGALQLGLQALSPTKDIYRWEVTISYFDLGTGIQALSRTFRYELDNRADYNDVTLHYRNSLGFIDSLRVRGEIKENLEYSYEETESPVLPNYYDGFALQRVRGSSNNREIKTYKGDIGYLGKEGQERTRDMNVRREVWRERRLKWWPVSLITKSFELRSSNSGRFSMPVEFQLADGGSAYYTPDSVDLGEGIFNSNVCLAYGFVREVVMAVAGGDVTVDLNVDEVDPDGNSTQMRWRVVALDNVTELVGWTTQAYGPISFSTGSVSGFYIDIQGISTSGIKAAIARYFCQGDVNTVGVGNSSITNNMGVSVTVEIHRSLSPSPTVVIVGAGATVAFNGGIGLADGNFLKVKVTPDASGVTWTPTILGPTSLVHQDGYWITLTDAFTIVDNIVLEIN
jgi:hypothetical protein